MIRPGSRGRRWRRGGCWPARGSAPGWADPAAHVPALVRLGGAGCLRRQPVIARDAGGWASAAMVDEVYGHADVHDPAFDAALRTVWGEQQ